MHFAGRALSRMSLVLVLATMAVTAAGCGSAAGPNHSPSPTAPLSSPAPAPAGARTLADLGFAHGPSAFALPPNVEIATRVDQSNVVTLVLTRPAGHELAAWVRQEARRGGWSVTADAHDALVFTGVASGARWSAAFTGGDPSGLTFRRASDP